MKVLIAFFIALVFADQSFAQCTSGVECLNLREQANNYMHQADLFEKEKRFSDAADSYLSARARYILSAKQRGNGFFSDAAEDRRSAEIAESNYARVDELAIEQEQEAEAAARKKTKGKRNIASVSVPVGFTNLSEISPDLEN